MVGSVFFFVSSTPVTHSSLGTNDERAEGKTYMSFGHCMSSIHVTFHHFSIRMDLIHFHLFVVRCLLSRARVPCDVLWSNQLSVWRCCIDFYAPFIRLHSFLFHLFADPAAVKLCVSSSDRRIEMRLIPELQMKSVQMILLLSENFACAKTTWIIAFDVIGVFGRKFINSATKYRKGSTHTNTRALHAFSFDNFHWCRSFNWKIIHCFYMSSDTVWTHGRRDLRNDTTQRCASSSVSILRIQQCPSPYCPYPSEVCTDHLPSPVAHVRAVPSSVCVFFQSNILNFVAATAHRTHWMRSNVIKNT